MHRLGCFSLQFAVDVSGKRVCAENAERGLEYVCPLCGEPVILRRGEIKIPHFAHKSGRELCDGWHYDTSEWHYSKQCLFPAECREVVVESNGIKHRADILLDGIVIEFQHSPISAGEFENRNNFYTSCGYNVVWVFDMTPPEKRGQFRIAGGRGAIWVDYYWGRAKSCFTRMPKFKQEFFYSVNPVTVYLSMFCYWEPYERIHRVVWWGLSNDEKTASFKNLSISRSCVSDGDLCSSPRNLIAPVCSKEELSFELRRIEYGKYLHKGCFVDGVRKIHLNSPYAPIEWSYCPKWFSVASVTTGHRCQDCEHCSGVSKRVLCSGGFSYRCDCHYPEEVRSDGVSLCIE